MRGSNALWTVATSLLLIGASSAALDDSLTVGRAIYTASQGTSPIQISFLGQPLEQSSGLFPCASCHGERARGDSEGGIVAPPLTRFAALSEAAARQALLAALVRGVGFDGRSLGQGMPRYSMAKEDVDALLAYLRTMPNPSRPGLTPSVLTVGLDMRGSGLSPAELRPLIEEMEAQANQLGETGLFGRRIEIVDMLTGDRDVFVSLSWLPRATGSEAFGVSIRPPSAAEAPKGHCASLQPSIEDQYRALLNYLHERSIPVETILEGPQASFDVSTSELPRGEHAVPSVRVVLGRPQSTTAGTRENEYYFADLLGPAILDPKLESARIIIAAPVERQVELASVLMTRHNLAPRSAGSIAALMQANTSLLTALAAEGRAIDAKRGCDTLALEVRKNWSLFVIQGNDITKLDVVF
ncbi:MAG: cytochrome c [Erythrobacter sp.]